MKMDLLFSQSSGTMPSSISLDTSKYKFFIVREYSSNYNAGNRTRTFVMFNSPVSSNIQFMSWHSDLSTITGRDANLTSSALQPGTSYFTKNYYYNSSATSTSSLSGSVAICRIYGCY